MHAIALATATERKALRAWSFGWCWCGWLVMTCYLATSINSTHQTLQNTARRQLVQHRAIGANCECRSQRQHALGPSYGVNELVDKKFFQQLRIVLGMGSRRDVAPHLALQRVKLDRFEGGSQGICCGSHQR